MGGILAAYMITLGIVTTRWVTGAKQAPPPFAFAGTSLIFAGCGAIGQANAKLGNTLAWGFTLAAIIAPGTQKIGILGQPPVGSTAPVASSALGTILGGSLSNVTPGKSTSKPNPAPIVAPSPGGSLAGLYPYVPGIGG